MILLNKFICCYSVMKQEDPLTIEYYRHRSLEYNSPSFKIKNYFTGNNYLFGGTIFNYVHIDSIISINKDDLRKCYFLEEITFQTSKHGLYIQFIPSSLGKPKLFVVSLDSDKNIGLCVHNYKKYYKLLNIDGLLGARKKVKFE